MLQGVDTNVVKQYNTSLKQYKEQSARLSVEIEMNEKELKQICEQLSAELGTTVTPENVEEIYNEQVNKINQTLETGNAILKKIEQEAAGVKVGTVQPTQPVQPAQPVQPTQPVQPQAMPGMAPVPPSLGGTQGQLFTGQSLGDIQSLPQPGANMSGTVPFNSGTPFFNI